jgi:hypothetical protein
MARDVDRRSVSLHRSRKSFAAGALLALILSLGTITAGAAPAAQTAPSTTAPCAPSVKDGAIPSWASAGFTPRNYHMHFELGHANAIVALLWKFPLLSPPAKNVANKVLWVSRLSTNGSPLVIRAQRMAGTKLAGSVVRQTVAGGPGPSYVNLPMTGCWRLDLSWSGHADSLDLDYLSPSTGSS